MNSRFLAQHFTVNISKFQLPRKGVKSQLSRSSCMYMAPPFKCRSGRGSNFGTTSKPLELRSVLAFFLADSIIFFGIGFCNFDILRTAPCAASGTAYKVWPQQGGGQGVGVKRPKITAIIWCLKAKKEVTTTMAVFVLNVLPLSFS